MGEKVMKKVAKKMIMRNVLCCLVIIAILMSAMPGGAIVAMNGNNSTNNSDSSSIEEGEFVAIILEEEELMPIIIPKPSPPPTPAHPLISDSLDIPLEPGEYKLEIGVYPGESVSKELILRNSRDFSAYNVSHTPVAGNATDMISIELELIDEIKAGEEEGFIINVSVPEDQELGNYTGYSYFLFSSDGFPPPMPVKVDFLISVVPKVAEIYCIDLKIDDQDEVAVRNVTSNETASFEITVINTGMYFDVILIEEPELAGGEGGGWDVKLYDEEEEVAAFPDEIPLNAGKEHRMVLNVTGTTLGTNLTVEITGRSIANVTKVDSVRSITYIKPKEEVVNATKIAP